MSGSLAAVAPAAQKLIQNINGAIVNPLIVVLFAAALVAFVWGVRGYITNADNPEARALGAQQMLWGIVGMGIMLLSFTIVQIVISTFGIGSAKVDGGDTTLQEVNAVIGK